MTDLQALTDAFAELERRADATVLTDFQPRRVSRPRARLLPVAATVVVVAGLAVGAVLLAPRGTPHTEAGAPPSSTARTTPPSPTSTPAVPRTADELITRFRAALGGTANFTVALTARGGAVLTVPPAPTGTRGPLRTPVPAAPPPTMVGAYIAGTLTVSGHTGGFDLDAYPALPADRPSCAEQEPGTCTVTNLPDGSVLRTLLMRLEGSPHGVTYEAELYRADGVHVTWHVSNQRSPKGDSPELGPQPPLTLEQMTTILKRW